MSKSRIIILFLIVVASVVIAALVSAPVTLKQLLGDEGYKQLWQLSLASIIGGLVSAAFSELKREQDTTEARREYLRAFHSTALTAYNRSKKVRRLLRAKAFFDSTGVPHVRQCEWETQMLELQDVQLQFESMKRQVRLGRDIFARAPDLETHLKTMEGFLRKVLSEFESFKPPVPSPSVPLATLPELQGFADYATSPPFVTAFADPYDEVEAALLKLLST